jgi:hypothetical protein
MATLDELRRGSQRLAATIDGSDFAPIRRDLAQLRAQTALLEARTQRADDGADTDRRARALLFLARRGVDATAMDTDALLRECDEDDEAYYESASDAPPDDVDGWLQVRAPRRRRARPQPAPAPR